MMSEIGWEFYGIKFSVFITMFLSILVALDIWLGAGKHVTLTRTDIMAGDEGDD